MILYFERIMIKLIWINIHSMSLIQLNRIIQLYHLYSYYLDPLIYKIYYRLIIFKFKCLYNIFDIVQ